MLAGKDQWNESRDNLHDQQTPVVPLDNLVADNEVITKPRHGGEVTRTEFVHFCRMLCWPCRVQCFD